MSFTPKRHIRQQRAPSTSAGPRHELDASPGLPHLLNIFLYCPPPVVLWTAPRAFVLCRAVFAIEAPWLVTCLIHLPAFPRQNDSHWSVSSASFQEIFIWDDIAQENAYDTSKAHGVKFGEFLINPTPSSSNILKYTGELSRRSCDRSSA